MQRLEKMLKNPRTKRAKKAPSGARRSTAARRAAVEHDHDNADICACDMDFTEMEQTQDADLPPARGGVAMASNPRRLRAPKSRRAVKRR